MKSIFSTSGLARASSQHPWRTLALWLLIIATVTVLSSTLGGKFSNEQDFTNNPESKQAQTLLEERLRGKEPLTETVVVHSDTATVDAQVFQDAIQQTTADLVGMPNAVQSAANYYDLKAAGNPAADGLVSNDGHTTLILVTLVGTHDDAADYGPEYMATIEGQTGDGIDVYSVGDVSSNEIYGKIAEEDLSKDLKIGLPVAAIVLIVVFGALVAAGLPILLGLVSIVVATGLTTLVANVMGVSDIATIMITMIGLAVGIDYALIVIERYREERRHGLDKHDAVAKAGGTAGKAVLFSGGTVVLALLGMFLIPISVFHSLAAGAILAVGVAVLATQTLVPAMLGLLGDKINWPRRPKQASAEERDLGRIDPQTVKSGFWGRVTHAVMSHPVVTLVIAVGILLVVAAPVTGINTGLPSIDTLPESNVKTGYEILQREFYAGMIAPVEIVVDGDTSDAQLLAGIDQLEASLQASDLYGPTTITQNNTGNLTLVEVPMALDPDSPAAYNAVKDLRGEIVPQAFGDLADHVYVGGASASTVDFNTVLNTYTPIVFGFVLGLSFLLLMLAFRSIVVPLKAIIMNLLSVAAAYGVLVAVFQHGFLAGTLGVQQSDTISAWIPVFLFCVLFGLSMDYHVFLLSRIREHYDATRNNSESVAVGLQSTGKIITGAALIMVAIFGAFATGRLVEIQQMGLGLAVAVFLDATIVRTLLVPAGMKLLGDYNWYMPHWLGWLPDVRIEGEPALQPVAVPVMPAAD